MQQRNGDKHEVNFNCNREEANENAILW